MNKITLLGRLGNDPETKQVGDTQVARVSLATSEKYKNKAGEKVEDTTWHNLEFWGKQAEVLTQYAKKGSQLLVIGQQRHEKVDEKYYSKVRVSEFEFIGSVNESANKQESSKSNPEPDGLPF